MNVERIDVVTLSKLLSGKLQYPVTCIVKFYSNTCGYCHALEVPYRKLASEFKDVLFFAINSEQVPEHLTKEIGVNGVPTIVALPQVRPGRQPRIKVLRDPVHPHPTNFYYITDIRNFIIGNNRPYVPRLSKRKIQKNNKEIKNENE